MIDEFENVTLDSPLGVASLFNRHISTWDEDESTTVLTAITVPGTDDVFYNESETALAEVDGFSTLIDYPAPNMAYVKATIGVPPGVYSDERIVRAQFITLLYDDDTFPGFTWRVRAVGEKLPPEDALIY